MVMTGMGGALSRSPSNWPRTGYQCTPDLVASRIDQSDCIRGNGTLNLDVGHHAGED